MMHQLRSTRHGIDSRSCSACGAGLMAGNVYCIDCGARIESKGLVVPNDEHPVEGVDVNEEGSLNATAPNFSPFASSLPVDPSSLPSEASYYENAQRALVVAKTIGLPLTADSLATTHELLKLQAMVQANPKAAQLGQLSIQPPLQPPMPTSLPTLSSPHFRKAHISPAALRSRPLNSEASDPFQEPHRNLYVANFDESLGEKQIEDLFGAYCEVRRVVMKDVTDRSTGELKGHYAFVWTGGVDQATEAKNALHNAKINGKKLQVKYAREGAFKITSMTITTDAAGETNRKVVTLRSDVGGESEMSGAASPLNMD